MDIVESVTIFGNAVPKLFKPILSICGGVKRMFRRKSNGGQLSVTSLPNTPFGVIHNGMIIDHEGVRWRVLVPASDIFGPTKIPIDPLEVDVEPTPRCPACGAELEAKKGWFGFTWWCIRGDFKKWFNPSFVKAAHCAAKLARRENEKRNGGQG